MESIIEPAPIEDVLAAPVAQAEQTNSPERPHCRRCVLTPPLAVEDAQGSSAHLNSVSFASKRRRSGISATIAMHMAFNTNSIDVLSISSHLFLKNLGTLSSAVNGFAWRFVESSPAAGAGFGLRLSLAAAKVTFHVFNHPVAWLSRLGNIGAASVDAHQTTALSESQVPIRFRLRVVSRRSLIQHKLQRPPR